MSTVEKKVTATAKKDSKFQPTAVKSCMMTPSYPMMISSSPYGIVSPVFVPYVQAPVCYVKDKAKKKTKTEKRPAQTPPSNVRYVSALKYTPINTQMLCYNSNCLLQVDAVQSLQQRLGIPYAMQINPKAGSFNRGYVSALTPPTSYVCSKDVDVISKSDLNPLSRPYTPPSRQKHCSCGHNPADNNDSEREKQDKQAVPSSDLCCDSDAASIDSRVATPVSRVTTPVSSYCSKWSGTNDMNSSDSDSGVEGECDEDVDEIELSTEDVAPNSTATTAFDLDIIDLADAVESLDFCCSDEDQEKLSPELSRVVDFLCEHLDSCEWRTVARELGVNDLLIQSLEYDFYESFRDQMRLVFTFWAKSQKSKSFRDSIAMTEIALFEIGRKDLIRSLNTQLQTE